MSTKSSISLKRSYSDIREFVKDFSLKHAQAPKAGGCLKKFWNGSCDNPTCSFDRSIGKMKLIFLQNTKRNGLRMRLLIRERFQLLGLLMIVYVLHALLQSI